MQPQPSVFPLQREKAAWPPLFDRQPTSARYGTCLGALIGTIICLGECGAAGCAAEFLHDVRARVTGRIQLTSDSLRSYAAGVYDAFGDDVDYAMLIKVYGTPSEGVRRYRR